MMAYVRTLRDVRMAYLGGEYISNNILGYYNVFCFFALVVSFTEAYTI